MAGRPARGRWLAYLAICLLAVALTAVLLPSGEVPFRRYFGGAHPMLVVVGSALLGGAALAGLGGRGFLVLRGRATWRGLALAAGLATLLAVAIVIADLVIRYPEDTNVPLPQAGAFYPAVGFVAEIVFHVLPLALLLPAAAPLGRRLGAERAVWLVLVLVAAAEPTFQVALERGPLGWASAYTWVHVFVIALLQLHLFRRYDFVTMYALRLAYYAYWHVLWGAIRLRVLF